MVRSSNLGLSEQKSNALTTEALSLKVHASLIANLVSTCFSLSVTQAELRKDIMNSIVCPVFKTTTKSKHKNYHPASLTNVAVKTLENNTLK